MEIHAAVQKDPQWASFKFETPLNLSGSFRFQNVDEAADAPLVQQLFYLPFVKEVQLSADQLLVQRFNILEWEDVLVEVADQIKNYLADGGMVFKPEFVAKKVPVSIYAESTPNPEVMKFVANKALVEESFEFKNIDEAQQAPLVKALFQFPFVREVFVDYNYLSITKYNSMAWEDVVMEIRSFLQEQLAQGVIVVEKTQSQAQSEALETADDNRTQLETQIINILEEYIKPAVASDGGNIVFQSFDEQAKELQVVLQGACSGCPSSTFTLKNGIETMLKDMLPGKVDSVVAING